MNEQHPDTGPLVKVNQLAVTYYTPKGTIRAVRDASLEIRRNEVLGVVGESGCGKSTVALSIMGYLEGTYRVEGDIHFEGKNILEISPAELRKLRGNRIAMVYQDPVTSLNPSMRVGTQLEEVLHANLGMNSRQARLRTAELFKSVGLADPEHIGTSYPHQLSGGMQQRIIIAMALACDPDLLIMDEPTTGLDVTTEATILDLVVDLKHRVEAGIMYVSHNLGVIARVADRVAVMYAGQIVEQGTVRDIFKNPLHPYTSGLLTCVPQPPTDGKRIVTLLGIPGAVYDSAKDTVKACLFASRCPMVRDVCREEIPPLLRTGTERFSRCFFWNEVRPGIWGEAKLREKTINHAENMLSARNLRRFYGRDRRKFILFGPKLKSQVRALVDTDFDVKSGRTLGIVGESGSGKTTIARVVSGLTSRDHGDLRLRGNALSPKVEDRSKAQKAAVRMVFQNPTASLNPQLPIQHLIVRSLRKFLQLNRKESRQRAIELLRSVGLSPAYLDRLPGELSGGEQQRVALAGAFAGNADLILADEVVSALDVSVQAQVLKMLENHQREKGTSYIFISHDLGVVRYVSDDILVLYAGYVAESGPADSIFNPPSHPYTEALLSAAPVPDPDAIPTAIRLHGSVPTMREQFPGCFFAGRCPRKIGPICDQEPPPSRQGPSSPNHILFCHIPIEELIKKQKKVK